MSSTEPKADREVSIGTVLIVVGVLLLVTKFIGWWFVKKALSLLWPIVLILIGYGMYRSAKKDRKPS